MRRTGLVALLLVLPLAAACEGERYESFPALVDDAVAAGLEVRSGGDFGIERVRVVEAEGAPFEEAIAVSFPAGSASLTAAREQGAPEGGAQAYLPRAAGPVDAALLRYWVRFPEGFDFVRGGKLPGLYGGTATAGRRLPDGSDGFSTRFMWREGGAAEVYAYLPGSEEHGTSLGRGAWSWPTGRWVRVEQEVHLNTPGEDDGSIEVRVDGETVLEERDLVFRDTDDLQVEGVFLSTFFGGDDRSWATPVDQEVLLGGFELEPADVR